MAISNLGLVLLSLHLPSGGNETQVVGDVEDGVAVAFAVVPQAVSVLLTRSYKKRFPRSVVKMSIGANQNRSTSYREMP